MYDDIIIEEILNSFKRTPGIDKITNFWTPYVHGRYKVICKKKWETRNNVRNRIT